MVVIDRSGVFFEVWSELTYFEEGSLFWGGGEPFIEYGIRANDSLCRLVC